MLKIVLDRLPRFARITLGLLLSVICVSLVCADEVIMKDGTVYKGKIMIDTDKAILIGNPPFDPNSYLLEAKDIEKIIYEEYKPNPPAERKRGLTAELQFNGNAFSSNELSLGAAPGFYGGLGFRVHPLFEINGGMDWLPTLHAGDGLLVSDGTSVRQYEDFWMFSGTVFGRLYPFYQKKWKTEPYLGIGYSWSRLTAKGSGDYLSGSGYLVGFGAIRPISTHWFLEGRFFYQDQNFDTIHFRGTEGSISPEITERRFLFGLGLSYRL